MILFIHLVDCGFVANKFHMEIINIKLLGTLPLQEQRLMGHCFAEEQMHLISLMISAGTGVTSNGVPLGCRTLFNSSCFHPYTVRFKLGGKPYWH